MDDFLDDRAELSGALISLEFGPGGRIAQLWAADPTTPEDSEEFQFVLGPVSFGEEFSEDYYPGTILLGARTRPDEPWIVSRNVSAETIMDDDDPSSVKFEYDFPLLPEIKATGRFYELVQTAPQICWDLELVNRGRVSIEIGELAFPFALYNFMQGASKDEKTGRNPYQDRVYIHKFIGGSASYLHAQRMSNEGPGIIIFPGDDTGWEMYTHVPRSLSSPYHWEGIPVVYIYSRASVDREGWNATYTDHSSLILEPGDSKKLQMRMVPTSPEMGDPVFQTLSACGRPAMRVLPAAVAPTSVGIGIEIGGSSPKRFSASKGAEIETDSDETGGFCFVRPSTPGPMRVWFEDANGGRNDAQLLFVEPIEDLIKKRATWICANQVFDSPGHSLHRAILATNIQTHEKIADVDDYATPFALESGIADALFLAEKNAIYPDRAQVEILEQYLDEFLRDDLQNPADGAIGSAFADFQSVALNYGRPRIYPLVFNFYLAMARISRRFGILNKSEEAHLLEAARVADALFRVSTRPEAGGLPTYFGILEVLEGLTRYGATELAESLHSRIVNHAREALRQPVNDMRDLTGDAGRFEQVYWSARFLGDQGVADVALRHAFALRDLGPSWWSYGSDYQIIHEFDGVPHDAVQDKGQLMLGHSSVANSLMLLEALATDNESANDVWIRMAFGGLMGVWALVRPDGAASMGFCPDAASGHYGFNALTGDIGASLFQYLRRVRSLVIPSRQYGVTAFGCHFESSANEYVVQPWDGVGQRLSLRHIGLDVDLDVGRIRELRLDIRKRYVKLFIDNPTDFDVATAVEIRGLWGHEVRFEDQQIEAAGGAIQVPFDLIRGESRELFIEVVK